MTSLNIAINDRSIGVLRTGSVGLILLVVLLALVSQSPVKADTTVVTSENILLEEIDRLSGPTLSNTELTFSGLGRTALSDYREALSEFRSVLTSEKKFPDESLSDSFDPLAEVIESFNSLMEHEEKEDTLEALKDRYEEQYELVREENISPGTDWLENYQKNLNDGQSLLRHHQYVVDLAGFFLAETLSNSADYRFRLYTYQLGQLFPDVLQETVGNRIDENHATRIYLKLLEEVTSYGSNRSPNSTSWTRFRSLVRSHGYVLKRLGRLGYESRQSNELLEAIDRTFQIRSLTKSDSSLTLEQLVRSGP